MKILFLDIDGVVNSKDTIGTSTSQGVQGIDPYLSLLVHRIIEASKCEVVLSSSWRHFALDEVKRCFPIYDVTPSCDCGTRGCEIRQWLQDEGGITKYAILDDDDDMLIGQQKNFFQTSFDTGITDAISKRVIDHFTK